MARVPAGKPPKRSGAAGGGVDGVRKHFGRQSAREIAGVILAVFLVVGRRRGGKLIRLRRHDRPDQVFQIKLVLHEILRQCVQQRGVRRRVGDPHVVDGLDQVRRRGSAPTSD